MRTQSIHPKHLKQIISEIQFKKIVLSEDEQKKLDELIDKFNLEDLKKICLIACLESRLLNQTDYEVFKGYRDERLKKDT